jgi:hypothetical protein
MSPLKIVTDSLKFFFISFNFVINLAAPESELGKLM